jgi:hypothetical protein
MVMNIKKIIREEINDLDWLINTVPTKWDYFEDLIKNIPVININKNKGGEWVDFRDNDGVHYFSNDFFEDYDLDENIKSNPLPDFLNAISQVIEIIFTSYDEGSKDYEDYLTLKRTLEKANKQDLPNS